MRGLLNVTFQIKFQVYIQSFEISMCSLSYCIQHVNYKCNHPVWWIIIFILSLISCSCPVNHLEKVTVGVAHLIDPSWFKLHFIIEKCKRSPRILLFTSDINFKL